MQSLDKAEDLLDTAVTAARSGGSDRSVLDALPVPVYTTDADGEITYWNRACVEFAGREPSAGDRWCVTWKLFTTEGQALPHEDCPMAVAIRQRRAVRDEIAVAQRPDGSRVAFRPYATPLFDEDGAFVGGINLLIDISEEQAGALSTQADRCRRLSRATHDRSAADVLKKMASGYDDTAKALRANH